jgi:hypothetical protein
VLAVASIASISTAAAAHEQRTVGPYALEIGWLIEPAYLNSANAVSLEVMDTDAGTAVDHLEKTMQVEVIVGGAAARRTFEFKPIPQEAGHYQAEFIPTAPGDYTFRVFGTIGATKIDERFESGPGRFDPVMSNRELQFPKTLATTDELAGRLDQLQLIAVAGLVLGFAGLVLAVVDLVKRR